MKKEEAISYFKRHLDLYCVEGISREAEEMAIKALETKKVGEWCPQNDDYFDWYECSECGYVVESEMQHSNEYDARTNYCPDCGAKMSESEG